MSRAVLIRAGGIAAIAGGLLRAAASFSPGVGSEVERQLLYLVVDVLLLLGLLGFYALRHQDLGWTGALGFLLALSGIVVVRSSRAIPGLDLYPVGALTVAGGLIVMCVKARRVKTLALWIPLAFVVSATVGVLGTVVSNAAWLFVLSGILFGAAFAGVGQEVWSAARRL